VSQNSFAKIISVMSVVLFLCLAFSGAQASRDLDPAVFLPRINIVHLDQGTGDTQYYFLAAVPMTIFHYNEDVYTALLLSDDITDQTVGYMLDDWAAYLDQHPGLDRHLNFIGGVSGSVQTAVASQFGVTDPEDISVIEGTPIQVANEIAEHDWRTASSVVIAPYLATLTDQDRESIANAAVIAALNNVPLLFSESSSLSSETLDLIGRLGADQAVLVEIGDALSSNINTQLSGQGVTVTAELTTEAQVVAEVKSLTNKVTLCALVDSNDWQHLPAALSGARYGGYVLYLPPGMNKMANNLSAQIKADPELHSYYKLTEPPAVKSWMKEMEKGIADDFYAWLDGLGGSDPSDLETVITFEPQGTGGGDLETTFERSISGDASDLTRPGAIPGRMPLSYRRNIALANRTAMYRATIFANPRPQHVTLSMNAYEVQYSSGYADSWGSGHNVNEVFGWPTAGWSSGNGYFPWDDIHTDPPDLDPILPPPANGSAGHDPGQFASFLSAGYETHWHSGSGAGTGSHPAQPDVTNIGFVQDMNDGSAFLYFSCHGGGTVIAVRATDNGIAQDSGAPTWGQPYWPDDDQRVYDGSAGGSYYQANLDSDLDNAHGMMIAYNACDMAEGYMNEVLLEHGGTVSIGSYTSVSFNGSGWWWNIWVHLVTHEQYTTGEAAMYATARVSDLMVPASKGPDTTLRYVVYGDPNCPFIQTSWTSPAPDPINTNYGGHKPDKPENEFAGSIVPDTIVVNVPTNVTVTLLDTAGVGVDSALVTVEGWGVGLSGLTDPSGQKVFNIDAPYGEELLVTGEKEAFDTFVDTIFVVGASDFVAADITVEVTEVGLVDTLTPYYEGVMTGTCDQTGFTLYANGCGVDTSTTAVGDSVDMGVTPTSTGLVKGAIAKSGYNVYAENIPCISVYGTLSGAVVDASSGDSLADVRVKGFNHGADTSMASPVFNVVSDPAGIYSVPGQLPVGLYDLYSQNFGYLNYGDTTQIMYGANVHDVILTPAPSGTVSGICFEQGTGTPLNATIRVYRADDMSLHTTVYSDSLAGGAYSVVLPYFNYVFRVTAYQHQPITRAVTVDEAAETQDFKMAVTSGNILVINDDDGSKDMQLKYGKKGQLISRPAGVQPASKAGETAAAMAALLEELGYYVVQETPDSTDPGTWLTYDFILWSDGDDTQPVSNEPYRTSLENYVGAGGKLLIEGGEVGYDALSYPGYPTFAANVLHSDDWNGDESGDLGLMSGMESHPIASAPNLLPTTFGLSYVGYGDQDACSPAGEAYTVYDCASDPGDAGVLVYDDTPSPESAQIVFFCFNWLAIADSTTGAQLLENTAAYLLTQETPPTGGISGVVDLSDTTDESGVIVTAVSGGKFTRSDTTDTDGNYLIAGLYNVTYSVTASKLGYVDSTATGVVVQNGQVTEDVNFTLYPLGGISGTVDLKGTNDESGVVVTATSGGKFTGSDTTDVDGSYFIEDLYDATYSVTASKLGYVDSTATGVVVQSPLITENVDFNLYPQQVIFFQDFEDDGYMVPAGPDWEWGQPTSGPGSAHSGTKVWATKLAGDYSSSSNSTLDTEGIEFRGASQAILTFWSWYSFEGTSTLYDGGNVKISLEGGPYSLITPVDGYDGTIYSTNAGIPNEQGFAGPSTGDFWHQETFDLTPYVGYKEIFLRFHFGSDGSVTYPGWYIDDLMITAPADVPDPAENLTAELMGDDIHLSWTPPAKAKAIDHYIIYRSEDYAFTPSPADSIGATSDTFFVDTDSEVGNPGTNHYYAVEAVGSGGYCSAPSNCVGEFDIDLQAGP
jgi:hypothetical protein